MPLLELLTDPASWIALLTLTALELVLGIDNIIFISILVDRLPPAQREKIRKIGLFLAMFMRLALLATLAWISGMSTPLFSVGSHGVSGRDLVLLGGGLFLVWKSVGELRELLGTEHHDSKKTGKVATAGAVLAQIIVIDLVFSLDSIITAVGLVDHIAIMMAAVVLSVGLMMVCAGVIGNFVNRNPGIKILALAFLVMIGVVLLGEGSGFHLPKTTIYVALAFALIVELMNMRLRKVKHQEK